LGWTRVAEAVAERLAPETIDGIWLFAPVRRESREWGTAIIASRADGERRLVYTARYVLVIRGKERGRGKVVVEEVGESPVTVLHEVVAGVQERAGEVHPPVEIAPELWFPPGAEAPPPPGGASPAASERDAVPSRPSPDALNARSGDGD
jgi:hypothetical protein